MSNKNRGRGRGHYYHNSSNAVQGSGRNKRKPQPPQLTPSNQIQSAYRKSYNNINDDNNDMNTNTNTNKSNPSNDQIQSQLKIVLNGYFITKKVLKTGDNTIPVGTPGRVVVARKKLHTVPFAGLEIAVSPAEYFLFGMLYKHT